MQVPNRGCASTPQAQCAQEGVCGSQPEASPGCCRLTILPGVQANTADSEGPDHCLLVVQRLRLRQQFGAVSVTQLLPRSTLSRYKSKQLTTGSSGSSGCVGWSSSFGLRGAYLRGAFLAAAESAAGAAVAAGCTTSLRCAALRAVRHGWKAIKCLWAADDTPCCSPFRSSI